jgi:hypothetical protein
MSIVEDKATGGGGSFNLSDLDIDYTCTITEQIGDAVYQSGNGIVSKADNAIIGTARVVGFIASKPTNTTCKVRTANLLTGLAGLVFDKPYFLGLAGSITNTAPAVGVLVRLGTAYNQSSLLININNQRIIRRALI